MNAPHPAYPTTAEVRLHGAAVRRATREWENNARIRRILQEALTQLDACDLHGYSLIAGMNLCDTHDTIAAMLPDIESNDAGEALNTWAREQVGSEL